MFTKAKNIWRTAIAAVILTAAVAVSPTYAATLGSVNHFFSTLQTNVAANQTLIFTTPSGISEGETVSITFNSFFDLGSITEDDIDFEDDDTDLTTAVDCSGVEEAMVDIAGSTVMLTICAGDGGAIAAASVITVEIGAHASASGVGAGAIINPVVTGTYYVSIDGTFGDTGSIAVPIGQDDTVIVSGTVPGDSGGGDLEPPGDESAPIISNIIVSGITS